MGRSIEFFFCHDNSKDYMETRAAGVAMTDIPAGVCVKTVDNKCYINDEENSITITGVTYDNYIKGQSVGAVKYGQVRVISNTYRFSEGDRVACDNNGGIKPSNDPLNDIGYVIKEENSYYIINLLIGGKS